MAVGVGVVKVVDYRRGHIIAMAFLLKSGMMRGLVDNNKMLTVSGEMDVYVRGLQLRGGQKDSSGQPEAER